MFCGFENSTVKYRQINKQFSQIITQKYSVKSNVYFNNDVFIVFKALKSPLSNISLTSSKTLTLILINAYLIIIISQFMFSRYF